MWVGVPKQIKSQITVFMAYLTTFLSKIFGKFVVTNQIYEIEGVLKSMGWVGSQVCDFFPKKTAFYGFP